MKFILLFVLLSFFTGCNEFYELKDKKDDDGSIIGTVTLLINQLGVSSAHAQTPTEDHEELSGMLVGDDFFSMYSSSDYNDIVVNVKSELDYYRTSLAGLVTSNSNLYSDSDFPTGIALSMGFDKNKKIVSLMLAPVDVNGKYGLKDPAFKNVAYYKVAFMLNDGGVPKYRLTYIFRDGKPMDGNVTFTSSVASVKLTEAMGENPNETLSSMKTKQANYLAAVKKDLPSVDEESVMFLYTSNHYQVAINPIQQFILQSALLHGMRSNAAFKDALMTLRDPFMNYLVMARPGVLADFCATQGATGETLITNLDTVIDQLIDVGLIPGRQNGEIVIMR